VTTTLLPRRISNSESAAWSHCKRQYLYAFDQSIEPKVLSKPLRTGNYGHKALEIAYTLKMKGEPTAVALSAAMDYLQKEFVKADDIGKEILIKLFTIIPRYFAHYEDKDDWTILAVEQIYEIPITSDFLYVLKLDLLIQDNKTFELLLVDHKFCYDFWQSWEYDLNMQMPKYMGALRFNGMKVNKAIINSLRYRLKKGGNTDEELFKRTPITPSDLKIRNSLREHIDTSLEIMEFRNLSEPEKERAARRNMNRMACRNCGMRELCDAELEGQDTTVLREISYQSNTYNYNPLETEEIF